MVDTCNNVMECGTCVHMLLCVCMCVCLTGPPPPLSPAPRALSQDPRNFHAWNYRQFVVRLMGRPLEQELRYAEDMVGQGVGRQGVRGCGLKGSGLEGFRGVGVIIWCEQRRLYCVWALVLHRS